MEQMKLFLVISDSHGDTVSLRRIVNQYPSIQSIIHLGDYYRDAIRLKEFYPDKEYYMVPGNCDFWSRGSDEKILEIEGLKVLITHGNRYGVKGGLGRLRSRSLRDKLDIALFGHTHIPWWRKTKDSCWSIGSAGYSAVVLQPMPFLK